MNTYGLMSINTTTFNNQKNDPIFTPQNLRDPFVTALRIHNATLNILGYIPAVSTISGSIRILTGVVLFVISQKYGHLSTDTKGLFIGRFFIEAQATAIAQIGRGCLEAFVPYGRYVNIGLDVVGTINNWIQSQLWEFETNTPYASCSECKDEDRSPGDHIHNGGTFAHPNPRYPFYLKPLLLV